LAIFRTLAAIEGSVSSKAASSLALESGSAKSCWAFITTWGIGGISSIPAEICFIIS